MMGHIPSATWAPRAHDQKDRQGVRLLALVQASLVLLLPSLTSHPLSCEPQQTLLPRSVLSQQQRSRVTLVMLIIMVRLL